MHKLKQITSARVPHRWLAIALAALMAAVLAGVALASVSLSNDPSHRVRRIPAGGIFSHPPIRRAHVAAAGGVNAPPAGAELAAAANGEEIYTWQPSPAEETPATQMLGIGTKICVMERQSSSGFAGVSCYRSSEVESQGNVSVNLPSKLNPTLGATVLVPNGVNTVLATDKNGSSSTIDVADNVALVHDAQLASVSYRLPDGETHRVNVLEVVAQSESAAPPPPGSCQPVATCKVRSGPPVAPLLGGATSASG